MPIFLQAKNFESIIKNMGILQKLKSVLKIRESFDPGRLTLSGPLPREGNALIFLPTRPPARITLWLPALKGILSYFSGRKWVWGPSRYYPFIEYLLGDIELIPDLSIWKAEEPLRFIVDLNPPPSPLRENKLIFKSEYRFALDKELYPYANIIFILDKSKDEIRKIEGFLNFLGIKGLKETIIMSEETRTRTWDYLMYRGHSAGNMLVFIDFEKEKVIHIHDILSEILKGKVTFMGPEDGMWNRTPKDGNFVESLIGALSLSDLYITDNAFFTGLAVYFKIPILLVDSELNLPNSYRWKKIESKCDRDTLIETLFSLLKG